MMGSPRRSHPTFNHTSITSITLHHVSIALSYAQGGFEGTKNTQIRVLWCLGERPFHVQTSGRRKN